MLVAATSQVMLEEGYAAATSRRVAAKAGVKPALVHYYFPTMDELYLAVFRRGAAIYLERQQEALASDRPLHAFWDTLIEPKDTRLLLEFMGLANHRKEIRAEIAAWSERWREKQITALNFIVREHDIDTGRIPTRGPGGRHRRDRAHPDPGAGPGHSGATTRPSRWSTGSWTDSRCRARRGARSAKRKRRATMALPALVLVHGGGLAADSWELTTAEIHRPGTGFDPASLDM